MSTWGRAQNALHDLYDYEASFDGEMADGPAKAAGLTHRQWSDLIGPILEAVMPVVAV